MRSKRYVYNTYTPNFRSSAANANICAKIFSLLHSKYFFVRFASSFFRAVCTRLKYLSRSALEVSSIAVDKKKKKRKKKNERKKKEKEEWSQTKKDENIQISGSRNDEQIKKDRFEFYRKASRAYVCVYVLKFWWPSLTDMGNRIIKYIVNSSPSPDRSTLKETQ